MDYGTFAEPNPGISDFSRKTWFAELSWAPGRFSFFFSYVFRVTINYGRRLHGLAFDDVREQDLQGFGAVLLCIFQEPLQRWPEAGARDLLSSCRANVARAERANPVRSSRSLRLPELLRYTSRCMVKTSFDEILTFYSAVVWELATTWGGGKSWSQVKLLGTPTKRKN